MNKTLLLAVFLCGVSIGISGCFHHRHEGPAEHAGRKFDNAVDNARDHMHQADEDVEDASHRARRSFDHEND